MMLTEKKMQEPERRKPSTEVSPEIAPRTSAAQETPPNIKPMGFGQSRPELSAPQPLVIPDPNPEQEARQPVTAAQLSGTTTPPPVSPTPLASPLATTAPSLTHKPQEETPPAAQPEPIASSPRTPSTETDTAVTLTTHDATGTAFYDMIKAAGGKDIADQVFNKPVSMLSHWGEEKAAPQSWTQFKIQEHTSIRDKERQFFDCATASTEGASQDFVLKGDIEEAQHDTAIGMMAAEAVRSNKHEPVTVRGGSTQEQIAALKHLLAFSVRKITVHPATDLQQQSKAIQQEYNQLHLLVAKVNSLHEDLTSHAQLLKSDGRIQGAMPGTSPMARLEALLDRTTSQDHNAAAPSAATTPLRTAYRQCMGYHTKALLSGHISARPHPHSSPDDQPSSAPPTPTTQ